MADIDQILAGGAGASTRADFSGIANLPKAYWEGQDQRAKNDLRDAFKNGVPTLPDGSIDYGTMQRTLYQKGALDQGNALSGISARASELDALRGADGPPPSQPIVGPSTSRSGLVTIPGKRDDPSGGPQPAPQPPQGQPQAAAPQPAQQPTVMTVLAAQGIPNSELGKAAESIARQLGVDPTAPLNLQDPQVRNVLAPAVAQIKRMGLGQVQPPQPGDNPPQAPSVAQPVQIAAQDDPVLKRLTLLSASQDKQIAAAAKVRLEAYLKNRELTPDQKNAAASGQSLTDYQNRGDENAAQLAILKDSIIPKLDLSYKAADAAKDEINAIHRSREQLDASGGVFSGALAEQRLKLSKVAELLGVPNTDKIANTEAFSAAIGSRVLALVKGLGSGAGISNADRAFAEKMAGGNITLDEASIRKILDIGERAARSKIDSHNVNAGKIIKSNEALKGYSDVYAIEAPGQYKKTAKTSAAGAAQTFNSPSDVHAAIAAGKLKKGDSFVDGAGTTRVVP